MSTTLVQVYDYLTTQSGARTVEEIAIAFGVTPAEVLPILIDNSPVVFTDTGSNLDLMLTGWSANPTYAVTLDDQSVITSLEAVICTPAICNNDVDSVLAAQGVTKEAWVRGSTNLDAIVDMLRCGTLRTKLQSLGLDTAKLDGMLDSCNTALLVNDAMIAHHGQAGV